jgi:hypothetical protein
MFPEMGQVLYVLSHGGRRISAIMSEGDVHLHTSTRRAPPQTGADALNANRTLTARAGSDAATRSNFGTNRRYRRTGHHEFSYSSKVLCALVPPSGGSERFTLVVLLVGLGVDSPSATPERLTSQRRHRSRALTQMEQRRRR